MTQQLDRIENKLDEFINLVSERAINMEGRVKALETNQSHAAWVATWLSGIVASIVAAVILSWKQLTE
jgi:hypothetical protein